MFFAGVTSSADLLVGIVPGALGGIYARTHSILGEDIRDQSRRWTQMGLDRTLVIRRLFDEAHPMSSSAREVWLETDLPSIVHRWTAVGLDRKDVTARLLVMATSDPSKPDMLPVKPDDVLVVFGHPYAIRLRDHSLRVLREQLVPLFSLLPNNSKQDAEFRKQMTDRNSPSVDEKVINLEGDLAPGFSGAPLINSAGEVVGVADGGLNNGQNGICWAIPLWKTDWTQDHLNSVLEELGKNSIPNLFAVGDETQADIEAFTAALSSLVEASRTRFSKVKGTARATTAYKDGKPINDTQYDSYIAVPGAEDARISEEGRMAWAIMPVRIVYGKGSPRVARFLARVGMPGRSQAQENAFCAHNQRQDQHHDRQKTLPAYWPGRHHRGGLSVGLHWTAPSGNRISLLSVSTPLSPAWLHGLSVTSFPLLSHSP